MPKKSTPHKYGNLIKVGAIGTLTGAILATTGWWFSDRLNLFIDTIPSINESSTNTPGCRNVGEIGEVGTEWVDPTTCKKYRQQVQCVEEPIYGLEWETTVQGTRLRSRTSCARYKTEVSYEDDPNHFGRRIRHVERVCVQENRPTGADRGWKLIGNKDLGYDYKCLGSLPAQRR